jgi:hypothetical protein
MKGDIRVIGLVPPTHVLEDIRMDVPHGVTVIIPGDKAIQSKDLWRAINQKLVFQLPSAAAPPPTGPHTSTEDEAHIRQLEAENLALRETLKTVQNQQQKLDAILAALQGGGGVIIRAPGKAVAPDVADGTAPQFIPSEIKPREAETHIEEQREESTAAVSSAAERLRQIRRGQ